MIVSRSRVGALLGFAAFAALIFPLSSSAAIIASQPLSDEIAFETGDVPVFFSGRTELSPVVIPILHATGTVRSVRIRYDLLAGPGWLTGGIQVYLKECPTAETVGGYPFCRWIVSRDQKYGWDGTFIYPPDPDAGEIVFDFTSATDGFSYDGVGYTDGVPLDPTRSYELQLVMFPNNYKAVVFGHTIDGWFNPFYTLENVVATPAPPPPPPPEPTGKTYGDLGYDFSFGVNGSNAASQNLGNGSFAEGNKVTGIDVRVGTHPGNMIKAEIRELDSQGNNGKTYAGNYQYTAEGEHVYHYDLPEAFTPDPNKCYTLLFYQFYSADSTYYGHSTDVYHASTTNCVYGYDTDNRANLLQNPSLNVPGYIDYSFRIDTDGPTTTAPTCTEKCFDNVLFLPGIESSRLYDSETVSGKRLWEPGSDADAAKLVMNLDGTSVRNDIYTRDIIDNAYVPIKGNVYASFIANMNALKSDGKINDWEAAPYDWRLSLDDILSSGRQTSSGISYLNATDTPYVIQELKRLAATSKSGKVTIVAHSNGGLVAKALMQKLGPNVTAQLIDKVILVAVPQVGTPQALAGLLHGLDQGLPTSAFPNKLSPKEARLIGDTMPGLYMLIPSAPYFTYVDDPVVTFATSSLPDWVAQYGNIIHSQVRQHAFLTDSSNFRAQPAVDDLLNPTVLSDLFLTQAETAHQSLDSWTAPPGVQIIQIAGWGVPTTVSGIDYARTFSNGNLTVAPFRRFVIDGDGTVVVPSAFWMSTTTGAVNYWVNVNQWNRRLINKITLGLFNVSHANILELPDLDQFISDQITRTAKSLSDYTYFSTEAPSSTERRLRYTLHSPLTLDLYDNQGHHTGVSTTTGEIEEQIPGTYYDEPGDMKYLFTDATSSLRIIMLGYTTGTFTFEAEELQGDTLIASSTWQDMPTTPTTKVTLDVSPDLSSPLNIDKNGDGVNDYSAPPKPNGVVNFYGWNGFLQPINDTAYQIGQSQSVFKAGSTIPVKFQIKSADGTPMQATSPPLWLGYKKGLALSASVDESAYSDPATGGSTYKWDSTSQQYIYNWSTKGIVAGYWYKIYAQLDDGNTYSVVVGLR